jgi:hypothetical protein
METSNIFPGERRRRNHLGRGRMGRITAPGAAEQMGEKRESVGQAQTKEKAT